MRKMNRYLTQTVTKFFKIIKFVWVGMLKTFFIETGFFRKFKVIIKVLIEIILFCLASQASHC